MKMDLTTWDDMPTAKVVSDGVVATGEMFQNSS